jgi:uncharacterized protein (TIGR03435 family)
MVRSVRGRPLAARRSIIVALLAAATVGVFGARRQTQEPAALPLFEVASIKAAHGGPMKIESDPGRITINDVTLQVLIQVAFGLREYQYEGPVWLHTTRYDIVATTPSPQPRAVQLAMLRALLIDRFKITMHHESRRMPVYELVVGKNGSKLHPMDASLPVPFEQYSNWGMGPVGGNATELRGIGTVGQLCDFLTRVAGRPVLDRTNIPGGFEFRLLCAIEGFPGEDTSPSVFDAVQTQLGLKLEPRTSAVDVTVIDRVDKLREN